MMGFKDKFRNIKECKVNSAIYDAYYNRDIDENIIYVESRNGYDFTGNVFRIVEELSTGAYGDFRIYVFAHGHVKPKIEEYKKNYNLNIYKIIDSPDKACEILHKAKYVFTDSGIQYKYVKKQGQVFVNTWHGTIMKLMGIDNSHERLSMGIIQRSLLFSDYLIFPSDYLKDRLLNSFMLEEIYPGKILLGGYPRNSVFLDEAKRDEFKRKLGLENSEIFIYMPTFKGLVDNRKDEKQKDDVNGFLGQIDENLRDDQILFAKLHPYNTQEIDFSKFNHIRPFPKGFEIYDIVNGYTEHKRLIRVEDYHLWFKIYSLGYKGYNIQEPLYKMRDDRDAIARRKFKFRINESYVKYIGFKMLNIEKKYYIYIIRPILVGCLPNIIYKYFHKLKLRNKEILDSVN